jgi:hypothetical protein
MVMVPSSVPQVQAWVCAIFQPKQTLKMEAAESSKMLVPHQTTQQRIPEEHNHSSASNLYKMMLLYRNCGTYLQSWG